MNYLLGPSATKLLLAGQNKYIWARMPKLPFIENFSWSWNVDFQFYKELCFRGRNKKTVTNVGLFQDLKIPPEISKFCQTYTHTHFACVCITHTHALRQNYREVEGFRRLRNSPNWVSFQFTFLFAPICFSIWFNICQTPDSKSMDFDRDNSSPFDLNLPRVILTRIRPFCVS